MSKFITLPYSGSKAHIALWEEAADGSLAVLSVHLDLAEIPDHEEIDTYRFDMQTSFDTGLPTNGGNYPVADAEGKPLWVGCRISFLVGDYHINTVSGEGTFKNVDMYGGTSFVSDTPLNVYDRSGFIHERRCEQYRSCNTYLQEGPFKGFRMTKSKLGDPFEHGQVETYIKLIDDPRKVCDLVVTPASTFGA